MIDQQTQAEGKTAARVTPDDVDANIYQELYFTAEHGFRGSEAALESFTRLNDIHPQDPPAASLGQVTFCVLVLRNGTKLVGINYGAIDPSRHDAELGRSEARAAAVEQIWPLMGYELRTKLSEGK